MTKSVVLDSVTGESQDSEVRTSTGTFFALNVSSLACLVLYCACGGPACLARRPADESLRTNPGSHRITRVKSFRTHGLVIAGERHMLTTWLYH